MWSITVCTLHAHHALCLQLSPCITRCSASALLCSYLHAVPPGCKESVKDSARLLCADLAGWADADAFQQPLSCCHSLPRGRPLHGCLVGCLQRQGSRVHTQDCLCQVRPNTWSTNASAVHRALLRCRCWRCCNLHRACITLQVTLSVMSCLPIHTCLQYPALQDLHKCFALELESTNP